MIAEEAQKSATMKCLMDPTALKRWGKVVHAITLIGEQNVQVRFAPVGLVLATFNAATTICAKAIFEPEFFTVYDRPRGDDGACLVQSKALLKPFRSLRFLTKCATTCELEYDPAKDFLQVTLHYKLGGEVRYKLVQATGSFDYPEDEDYTLLPSLINAEPKLFFTIMSNFAHGKGVADLTIKPTGSRVLLKNCMTDLVRKDGKIYTELCVSAHDFYEYDVRQECELTIDMKEFKIFASFAETMKLPIALHFDTPQKPITITARSDDNYMVTLTLATRRVATARSATHRSSPSGQEHISSIRSNTQRAHLHDTNRDPFGPQRRPVTPPNDGLQENIDASRSPESRNVRSFFRGLGEQFDPARDIPGQDVVLVQDSDED